MNPPLRLPQAFFLPTPGGARFCLFHPAQGPIHRGQILYLPPWAEELNCSRRVVAQQARTLAEAGYAVLQIDLLGCGDSTGEWADATWQAWLADARQALRWLQASSSGPLWLWGLRAGALLAAALAAEVATPCHLLLWQPVINGQHMLQQFLRLHQAGQWLGTNPALRLPPEQRLAHGETVEIAGYALSPALAQGLAAARLHPAHLAAARLLWLEVAPAPSPLLSPAAEQQLPTWRAAGWEVSAQAVSGRSFWHATTTEDATLLQQATLRELATSVT
jgi:exosortase A-associated hydrolase 2